MSGIDLALLAHVGDQVQLEDNIVFELETKSNF